MAEERNGTAQTKKTEENTHADMPNVDELLKLLQAQGMAASYQALFVFTAYADGMEEALRSVTDELHKVQKQLNEMQKNGVPKEKQDILKSICGQAEKGFKDIQDKCRALKSMVNEKAGQLLQAFKEHGAVALNNVCKILGIKEALETMRDTYQNHADRMDKSVAKIENIEAELHAAGHHIKNLGRAIAGKEAAEDKAGESRFFKALKQPYINAGNRYKKMAADTQKAVNAFEGLEKKAQEAGEKKENRASLKEKLKTMQQKQKQNSPGMGAETRKKEMAL